MAPNPQARVTEVSIDASAHRYAVQVTVEADGTRGTRARACDLPPGFVAALRAWLDASTAP